MHYSPLHSTKKKCDSVAEWSKALRSSRSPKGREFEPHRCQSYDIWSDFFLESCWAHNAKAPRSKLSSSNIFFTKILVAKVWVHNFSQKCPICLKPSGIDRSRRAASIPLVICRNSSHPAGAHLRLAAGADFFWLSILERNCALFTSSQYQEKMWQRGRVV